MIWCQQRKPRSMSLPSPPPPDSNVLPHAPTSCRARARSPWARGHLRRARSSVRVTPTQFRQIDCMHMGWTVMDILVHCRSPDPLPMQDSGVCILYSGWGCVRAWAGGRVIHGIGGRGSHCCRPCARESRAVTVWSHLWRRFNSCMGVVGI